MTQRWTADQFAMQAIVWRLVLDGAVRAAPLAEELEKNARWVPPDEAHSLLPPGMPRTCCRLSRSRKVIDAMVHSAAPVARRPLA